MRVTYLDAKREGMKDECVEVGLQMCWWEDEGFHPEVSIVLMRKEAKPSLELKGAERWFGEKWEELELS